MIVNFFERFQVGPAKTKKLVNFYKNSNLGPQLVQPSGMNLLDVRRPETIKKLDTCQSETNNAGEFLDNTKILRCYGTDFKFQFAGFQLNETMLDRIDFQFAKRIKIRVDLHEELPADRSGCYAGVCFLRFPSHPLFQLLRS